MATNNFLTFDIEEWYHANYNSVDMSIYSDSSTGLERSVDRLIEICDRHDLSSTCFLLGNVAKNKPNIVKKLFDAGHEIASHGMNHDLVYNMTKAQFQKEIIQSTDILEQITGAKVLGFRAPSWSINESIYEWYYETLEHNGYKYSSSIYPASNPLFGMPNAISTPHMVGNILEIPQSIMNLGGYRCGFAGGGFFRFFPRWLIEKEIKKHNALKEPVFLYLHPREIEQEQYKLPISGSDKFFHYYGTGDVCERKLEGIISEFKHTFIRMDKYTI